jgi:hypothetical protein
MHVRRQARGRRACAYHASSSFDEWCGWGICSAVLKGQGCLERRVVLRYAELVRRKVVKEAGDILMDAPLHSNNDQLIGLVGGAGTAEEREVARKQ